ncbi:MAG: hypothetical protein PHT36_02065 [Patescibacteria group bacterium]|nr:hypothetical protein [Patescibacteria group bacterium]
MNNEKWGDLKIKIEDNFKDLVILKENEERKDDVGNTIKTDIETLEFTSPLGKIRIVRTSRPKIIEKKSHYHKGAGAAKIEYVLSEDEMHHEINIFKINDTGEWELLELPAEKFSF